VYISFGDNASAAAMDLACADGEFVGLIGPNGSGKIHRAQDHLPRDPASRGSARTT
jgi:ABC-type uncharacterized transport system ATPase subunit